MLSSTMEGQEAAEPPSSGPTCTSWASHCVRSLWDSSRSNTVFVNTVAFRVSPARATTQRSPVPASFALSSRPLSADLQAGPLSARSCRNQKHSMPPPACWRTALQASLKRRKAFLEASTSENAREGTRKSATQAQFPVHSPLHRCSNEASFSSSTKVADLTWEIKLSVSPGTICGAWVDPCRVAGSMTTKLGTRCTRKRSTTQPLAETCAKWCELDSFRAAEKTDMYCLL
mmetsp:Transcript_100884/g.289560  ORF Transcript_100884/g.289560 Transcript_100884/m.289560 type:complete len:231 (-) Transcript_100884:914-1606(-)